MTTTVTNGSAADDLDVSTIVDTALAQLSPDAVSRFLENLTIEPIAEAVGPDREKWETAYRKYIEAHVPELMRMLAKRMISNGGKTSPLSMSIDMIADAIFEVKWQWTSAVSATAAILHEEIGNLHTEIASLRAEVADLRQQKKGKKR